jgi:hypothetical protein
VTPRPHNASDMAKVTERSGVLIVRAWVEAGAMPGLRARITQSHDLTSTEQTVTTTSDIDDILSTVRGWLDALLSGQGAPR